MKRHYRRPGRLAILYLPALLAACATGTGDVYFEPNMDFGSLRTVAVLPFENLTGQEDAAERVRDTFMGSLLATEAVYVLPAGEVARGISRVGALPQQGPSPEYVKRLGTVLEVQAVITGVLREYGAVRSGATSENVISLSLQMIEVNSGRVVWSASSTKGGITIWHRLFGGGGAPMNTVTQRAVNALLDKLFQ